MRRVNVIKRFEAFGFGSRRVQQEGNGRGLSATPKTAARRRKDEGLSDSVHLDAQGESTGEEASQRDISRYRPQN